MFLKFCSLADLRASLKIGVGRERVSRKKSRNRIG
jgi:hypothetical protein